MSNANPNVIAVRVSRRRELSEGVIGLSLVPTDGAALPAYAPGAHVDLHLGDGVVRSYSLVHPHAQGAPYEVAVLDAPKGRGGSAWVHANLQEGSELRIGVPRNHFPLAEDAAETLLVAGGIGVTPLLCMAQQLSAQGRHWRMVYAARSRRSAALLPELAAFGERVACHFDDEQGRVLDMAALVASAPPGTQLYCCGPGPMLDAFAKATADRDPAQVHTECFSPPEGSTPAVAAQGFELHLARTGITIAVLPGETVLDKLVEAGCDVNYSCQEGVCGSCETRVLEGRPDHRDHVLSQAEREAGKTMMVCCSGSLGERLVLDL